MKVLLMEVPGFVLLGMNPEFLEFNFLLQDLDLRSDDVLKIEKQERPEVIEFFVSVNGVTRFTAKLWKVARCNS